MSNWYAYKVLADTYQADRLATAAHHRRAREARRSDADLGPVDDPRRVRRARSATPPAAASGATGPGMLASLVARLRRRPAAVGAAGVPAAELHPSMPC